MRIRRYEPRDREAALGLAPRLTIGVAAWRDPAAVLDAVHGDQTPRLATAAGTDAGWVRQNSMLATAARPHAVALADVGMNIGGHGAGRPQDQG
jgi:hypothetical protein